MDVEILAALKGRFSVRLARVRAATGLSKEGERECRKNWLEKGVDFEEVGHELRYAPTGLAKLESILQKKGPAGSGVEPGGAIGGKAGPEQGGDLEPLKKAPRALLPEKAGSLGPVKVTVWRSHFANGQVIECVVLGSVERVTVRVRSSEKFLPGMVLWARPEPGESAWAFLGDGNGAALEGAACPRWRGKF